MNQEFLRISKDNKEISKQLILWNIGEELSEESPKLNYYIKYYILLQLRGCLNRPLKEANEQRFRSISETTHRLS